MTNVCRVDRRVILRNVDLVHSLNASGIVLHVVFRGHSHVGKLFATNSTAGRQQCTVFIHFTHYSQTSLIRSSFIRIPRHPEEKSWLHIYSIRDASNINGVRLSGSLAYPDIFLENGCVRLSEV